MSQTSKVVQHLRRAVLLHGGAGLTDGELLGYFIEHRDEAAFAALVRRHGPLVWGVCRRLLNHHDAEDAFQATFLVLARKAASVRPTGVVANWLYGVAHRAALQARRAAARRRARERQVTQMPEPAVADPDLGDDLLPLLDQELSRLPEKYRVVLVLCDLEGKPRKEVAQLLGCPEGTVAGRLARARAMLARRLARHGLAVSGGALAGVLSSAAASGGVPNSVASATVKAAALAAAGQAVAASVLSPTAAALVEGVLKSMLLSKLKVLVTVLVGLAAVTSTWAVLARGQTGGPGERAEQGQVQPGEPVQGVGRKGRAARAARGGTLTIKEVILREIDPTLHTITVAIGQKKWPGGNVSVGGQGGRPGKIAWVEGGKLRTATTLADVPLAEDARITSGGKEIKLEDLKVGTHVTLELAADQTRIVVVGIHVAAEGG